MNNLLRVMIPRVYPPHDHITEKLKLHPWKRLSEKIGGILMRVDMFKDHLPIFNLLLEFVKSDIKMARTFRGPLPRKGHRCSVVFPHLRRGVYLKNVQLFQVIPQPCILFPENN